MVLIWRGNFMHNIHEINHYAVFENCTFKITAKYLIIKLLKYEFRVEQYHFAVLPGNIVWKCDHI